MWSMLLGLIPGLFSTVNGITNAIANERLALINAKTEQERIAAKKTLVFFRLDEMLLLLRSLL